MVCFDNFITCILKVRVKHKVLLLSLKELRKLLGSPFAIFSWLFKFKSYRPSYDFVTGGETGAQNQLLSRSKVTVGHIPHDEPQWNVVFEMLLDDEYEIELPSRHDFQHFAKQLACESSHIFIRMFHHL